MNLLKEIVGAVATIMAIMSVFVIFFWTIFIIVRWIMMVGGMV